MKIKTGIKTGKLEPINICGSDLKIDIAKTKLQRKKGLMFRSNLPENEGMLFIFDHPRRVGFWMMNTSIPLDVAFFTSNGVLTEIKSLQPFSKDIVFSQDNHIKYALEVNHGWFRRHC
ncbi:MAG: DUF192 domain-containing protein [Desulfobacterales bacterium]|nr:DUF192 domain-containing protein [Desulfobacterales bacterium]